jgi:hypothetical protein
MPALAQRAPVTPDEQQLHNQLQTFAVVLQAAVRHGGDAFARLEAGFIPPGLELFSDAPVVQPLAPPLGGGLLFYVSVPEIRFALNQAFLQRSAPRLPATDPLRPVAGRNEDQRASAASILAGDPDIPPDDGRCATRMKPSRGGADPNYEYAVAVCDSLMDAMLDNSGALPIKENEWLTVAAVDGAPDSPRIVNSSSGYATYLQIKGADLLAFRQGKISKEEARKHVEFGKR